MMLMMTLRSDPSAFCHLFLNGIELYFIYQLMNTASKGNGFNWFISNFSLPFFS